MKIFCHLSSELLVNGAKMDIYSFVDNNLLCVSQQFISHFTWLMLSKIFISGFTETPLGLKMNLIFVQEKKYPSGIPQSEWQKSSLVKS